MPTNPKLSDGSFVREAEAIYEKSGSYSTGNIEVDEMVDRQDCLVSRNAGGDDGAFVRAWVWVRNEDAERHATMTAKICDECGEQLEWTGLHGSSQSDCNEAKREREST